MATAAGPAGAGLPVMGLVATAYRYVLFEWRPLARLSLPWVAAGTALLALALSTGVPGPDDALLLQSVFDWVGYSAVAVAWLRHLVHGEPWPGWGAPVRAPVLAYLGWSVVVGLLAAVPIIFATAGAAVLPATAVILMPASIAVAVAILAHLFFVPVGAALGERPAFGQAARLIRGNVLRLIAGLVLAGVPLVILAFVLAVLLVALGSAAADGLRMAFTWWRLLEDAALRAVQYVDAAVAASFVAGAYGHLVATPGTPSRGAE